MDKTKRFFELKEQWKAADEAHRHELDAEIESLLDSMSEEEVESLTSGVQQDFDRMKGEAADIRETMAIREQLAGVLPFLSMSAFAREFFGKSSSWFCQRLNGNIVHGKPVSFSPDELVTLKAALHTLGSKLQDTSATIS